ncbi:MAG: drug/metabolite transporter (DMT)-like permease [Parasphingorhabdus sp.]|jgi:drug/metabolite transporter (DMT)-like permease
MQKKTHIDTFGATTLIVFSAVLGLNQVMVKMVNAGMHPVFQAGLRSLFAFGPVLLFAWLARKKLSVTDGSLLPGIAIGVLFAVEFLMLFIGLDLTSVARASIFMYTMPFWAAIGAHFLIPGERLTKNKLFGLSLAIFGVVIAFSDNATPVTNSSLLGDFLSLMAAICWTGILLLARTTKLSQSSPESQLLYQLGVSAVLLMPIALFMGDPFRVMTTELWAIFSIQVLLVVCVGFLTWFWILSIYPASSMASFSFLAPVFGVIFGWLILGEPISVNIVFALVLVSAGIMLVNRRTKKIR